MAFCVQSAALRCKVFKVYSQGLCSSLADVAALQRFWF